MKFLREDHYKKKRLKKVWRKPKGLHSKTRHSHRGHQSMVRVGYRSPVKQRLKSRPARVTVIGDLKGLENGQIIELARIGKRKKLEIVKEAIKLGLIIINLKEADKFVEDVGKKAIKKKPKEQKKKARSIEKAVEEELTEEEKKKQEKAEKDKVLTKKQM